jgi:hypothetical protein
MVVRLDMIFPKPGDPNAVTFWGWVMVVGPVLACVTIFRLVLTYRYGVGNRHYEGDTAQFGPRYVTALALIERLADAYPPGALVTVHYDPDAPGTSVLDSSDEMAREDWWHVWFFLVAPIAFSIGATIVTALS